MAAQEAAPNDRDVEVQAPTPRPHAAPASRADETRRAYAADWAGFLAWCRQQRLVALPAEPESVARYLAALSTRWAPGTLTRKLCAIADRHRQASHPSPGSAEAVRAVLRAARKAAQEDMRARAEPASRVRRQSAAAMPGAFPRNAKPPTAREATQLAAAAARCPGDLAGLRDCALLLLAAHGVGGSLLLGLDREHVQLQNQHVTVYLAGAQAEPLVIPRSQVAAACPVRALDRWIRMSDTRFGPLFRKVDRWANVEHQRLRADGLRRIWQRRLAAVKRPRPKPADTA